MPDNSTFDLSSSGVNSTIDITQSSNNADFDDNTPWDTLEQLANGNCYYFSTHQDENGLRIYSASNVILDILKEIRPLYKEISHIAPQFDFNENTPGNGYRSFLSLTDKCILHSIEICQQISSYKTSVLFRKSHYMRELEACSQLIASLCTFLNHLKTLYNWSEITDDGKLSLFPSDEHSPEELLNQAGKDIDQYCFYGRCLGFQFADSIKYLLKTILTFMASFSEVYYKNGSLLGRCTNSVKYMVDPEARARRIVNISQRADIHFCKTFWLLNETELVQFVPFLLIPSLNINQIISIPPEHLTLPTEDGKEITIPIPNSHIGKKPIRVRLLSAKRRIGMVGSARVAGELYGSSDTLLFHCHGGGFVAQSSKCHEIYLRHWAVQLDVPLLSIDYSLAPEAPYPRAVEEILYSYAWALKHANSLLGSTAKKIIFIGDSAGANLNMALTTKCFELNIRKPDGIFMAYVPVLVEFIPSPARMLGLTDPMLPFGFMMRCLKAYTLGNASIPKIKDTVEQDSTKSDTESFAEVSESDLIALALSPNGDETNENKLTSLPSDSTLNSVSLVDIDPATQTVNNQSTSQNYINKFVNLYKNFTFNKPSANNGNALNNYDNSDALTSASFFGLTFNMRSYDQLRELDADDAKSPSEEFVFTVPRDPLLSPYRISDNILKLLPPTKILTTDLDPCLDDSVMFARKLRNLNVDVSLDIVKGLPHGFLSFSLMSKDAHEGSELCIKRIKELIDL
ncbi:hormone-sensitive lipase [Chelonus insularis]|uniref:hormone-sensitive lipase n=1 Tax=Chelonus insularis TaxID=460826 RepID=UPI00158B6CCD|nr:hormone-sensitive lipase [Chelonus insularis]